MRGTAVVLVALLAGLAHQAHADERVQVQPTDRVYARDRVLVRLSSDRVETFAEKDLGVRYKRNVGSRGTMLYKITDNSSVEAKIAQLKSQPNVVSAEPDYKVFVNDFTPDDPRFPEQWHLPKISAPQAWDVSMGAPEVKVCVVDSGARMDHPDLAANIIKGFNLVPADQSNPNAAAPTSDSPEYQNYNDTLGHGTHVAGTIAALTNDALGVAGVAGNVKLVVCRFIWDDAGGYISDAMTCLRLCRAEGAMITSNSWGGVGYSDFLEQEINAANAAGQLFVVAAGNNGQNMEVSPLYPSSYKIPNVLSVASSDQNDVISSFSNYGLNTIHITAPGEAILATTYDGGYGLMWGTSMATPVVTGAAALVQSTALAAGVTLTHLEIKDYVLRGVDETADGQAKVITKGRLNVAKALQAVRADFPLAPSPPPPSPSPPPPSPSPPPPPSPSPPPPPSPSPPPPSPSPPPPSPEPSPEPSHVPSMPPSRSVACGESIARGKAAQQSSTSGSKAAPLAVDGSCQTDASAEPYTCSETDPTTDANPWWTVDLGEQVTVRGVLVTARSDISWNQLGFTQVLVGNVSWTGPESLASYTRCGSLPGAFGAGSRLSVYCNGGRGLMAQHVVLYRPGRSGALTICEVDVLSPASSRRRALQGASDEGLGEGVLLQGGNAQRRQQGTLRKLQLAAA